MFSLSKESEQELSQGVLTLIDTFLKSQDKVRYKGQHTKTVGRKRLETLSTTPRRYTKSLL